MYRHSLAITLALNLTLTATLTLSLPLPLPLGAPPGRVEQVLVPALVLEAHEALVLLVAAWVGVGAGVGLVDSG